MVIDWGEAVRIGLVGFGVVFFILVLLAVAIWLNGIVARKMESKKEEPAAAKADGGEGA